MFGPFSNLWTWSINAPAAEMRELVGRGGFDLAGATTSTVPPLIGLRCGNQLLDGLCKTTKSPSTPIAELPTARQSAQSSAKFRAQKNELSFSLGPKSKAS